MHGKFIELFVKYATSEYTFIEKLNLVPRKGWNPYSTDPLTPCFHDFTMCKCDNSSLRHIIVTLDFVSKNTVLIFPDHLNYKKPKIYFLRKNLSTSFQDKINLINVWKNLTDPCQGRLTQTFGTFLKHRNMFAIPYKLAFGFTSFQGHFLFFSNFPTFHFRFFVFVLS